MVKTSPRTRASFLQLITIAWRDARGSRMKALLYALSMAVGIAGLVAMMSFGLDLSKALDGKARELLGADLVLSGRQPFTQKVDALQSSLGGEVAEQIRFATMAHFLESDEVLLARVRAIEGNYPFYGTLETQPVQAAQDFRHGAYALVDATLMDRVGAKVGQEIRLGKATFKIAGILIDTPGESASAALMGPRIYIPKSQVEATELIQFGSRVFYSRAFRLDESKDIDSWVEAQKETLKQERLRAETVASLEVQLGESMAQLRDFLSLAACLALLLGGLGVASAVHYHLQQKAKQIAVMRCLGARLNQVLTVYLLQVGFLTLIATLVGVGIGVAFQFYLPILVKDFIPFDFEPSLQPAALAMSVGWGFLLCLALALAPLLGVRHISPIASIRVSDDNPQRRDGFTWLAYGGMALLWGLFAFVQTGSLKIAGWFLLGLITSMLLLLFVARLLAFLARKLLVFKLPFSMRYGIAGLFRPQNHTTMLTVILGTGVFLLVILAGSRTLLLKQFDTALAGDRPNFIAFDIQVDQVEGVKAVFEQEGIAYETPIPLVPMRLAEINGRSVEALMDSDIPSWMLQREYRSTYRSKSVETEELVKGKWVAEADDTEPIPVSLDADLAEVFQVDVGDAMVVNVMGVPLELQITSLRKIQWQSMQPNFYMVFPEGVLNEAPQMFLLTANLSGPAEVGRLQKMLIKQFPNVTCVDMTRIAKNIESILSKAAAIVAFLAGLCVLTGILLMGSSLWNTAFQRLGEHALLQTLGAKKAQVQRVALAEFLLLGGFSAAAGAILGGIATWALGRFLFDLEVAIPWIPILAPLVILPAFTAIVGYLSQLSLSSKPRYAVLRQETT